MSDFNNTVQTVTFRAGSGFETQEITLEFFDDALTESLTEFYILVVRLDNSSQNNAADVNNIMFEPRNGFAGPVLALSTAYESHSLSNSLLHKLHIHMLEIKGGDFWRGPSSHSLAVLIQEQYSVGKL